MKKLVALLLAVPSLACASTASLTWTLPTQNTDNSSIPASGPGSLTASVVERGTCSGPNVFGAAQESVTVNAPAVSYTFTGLAPGTYCFRVKVRNTYNAESDWSAVASKTITPPVPKPPILTVAGVVQNVNAAPVFGVTAFGNRSSTVVGFAPVGAECTGQRVFSYRGLSYYRITDTAQVIWWQTEPTLNAARPCV